MNRSDIDHEDLLRSPPLEAAIVRVRGLVLSTVSMTLRAKGVGTEDAEDLTQEAVTRVLEKVSTFRGDSRFSTWVRSVAIHHTLTYVRRRKAPTVNVDEISFALPSNEPGPEQLSRRGELLASLHAGISTKLTERQRHAIQAMLAGVPLVVLAERMSTNPNALYKLYHDARKRLRAHLEVEGHSEADVRDLLGKASSTRG